MHFTYSRWDGTQIGETLDAGALIETIADDVLAGESVESALIRVRRNGIPDGEAMLGTEALLERLRAQRHLECERQGLTALTGDVEPAVAQIRRVELQRLERRLQEMRSGTAGSPDSRDALAGFLNRQRNALDTLPDDPWSALAGLGQHDFVSPEARRQFDDVLDALQQHVLTSQFTTIKDSLERLTREGADNVADALRALNDLLEAEEDETGSEFECFRQRYGDYFPASSSLSDLVSQLREQASQTHDLVDRMPPSMQHDLDVALKKAWIDPAVKREMERFDSVSGGAIPTRPRSGLPGTPSPFEEALGLLHRLWRMQALETSLHVAHVGNQLDGVDGAEIHDLLGPREASSWEALRSLETLLEEAGYVTYEEGAATLTAPGLRRMGLKVLHDIFRRVEQHPLGEHSGLREGNGSSRSDATKPYEFGDAFHLDTNRTVLNAVLRGGTGPQIRLQVSDFEVARTELAPRTATVLMLDMSRSMQLRQCSAAARRVALALHTLIRSRFPRDRLYVVGFSDFGRALSAESLFGAPACPPPKGTNIQHGFVVARRILAPHREGTRQIVLISDGEPTVHTDGEEVYHAYPPTSRTVEATLQEVRHCTRDDIRINTFMLGRTPDLLDFVDSMTRINHGRAFFATPDRVDEYVLMDYVRRGR